MKLDSSTLFVNTGRKPLPAMQKKKKNNKNTVALVVCIAIIAVLCVFVGLIVHVWFNYNEEVAPKADTKVTTAINLQPKHPKQRKSPRKKNLKINLPKRKRRNPKTRQNPPTQPRVRKQQYQPLPQTLSNPWAVHILLVYTA